ncbi:PQ_loop repeat-containing protein [Hexamita inflata]|uniref:PQ loop repeat-containing protein n=1 Tax=Hexamita inflata TaxID=28002 RepID=A0AA86NBE5_9EUKA|nr:PQ loop repeat-containing protein [Hexamita inflata]
MYKDPCKKCSNEYDYSCYLLDISTITVVMGVILILGSFLSFVPQIIKLCILKKTDGMSFQMLHLALYNQWSLLVNFFMSQFPQVMSCNNTFWKCVANIIPQINSVFGFLGFFVPFLQYLYYQKREQGYSAEFKKNVIYSLIFTFYALVTTFGFVFSGFFFSVCDPTFKTFTFIFAFISMCCACVQWIPQIIKTYKLQAVGSFSIFGQCINVPGQVISLITLILSNNGWTTWITNIAQLIMQSVLLVLLLRYQCCEPYKSKNKAEKEKEAEARISKQIQLEKQPEQCTECAVETVQCQE